MCLEKEGMKRKVRRKHGMRKERKKTRSAEKCGVRKEGEEMVRETMILTEKKMTSHDLTVSFSTDNLSDPTIKGFSVSCSQPFLSQLDYLIGVCVLILGMYVFTFARLIDVELFYLTLVVAGWVLMKVNRVKNESVLVIKELGVQLQKKFYSGAEKHVFIDAHRIESVFINEGFHRCSVIFYLAFKEKEGSKLILAFEVCLHLLVSRMEGANSSI